MANIQIIVGSVTGTALGVARTIESVLQGYGHEVALNPTFEPGDLGSDNDQILLVCTSNTGMGELPENIAPFHAHLVNDLPKIYGRKFAIVNLGDSSYPSFAEAGETLEEALADLGATPLRDAFVLDATEVEDYDDEAANWATTLNTIL